MYSGEEELYACVFGFVFVFVEVVCGQHVAQICAGRQPGPHT